MPQSSIRTSISLQKHFSGLELHLTCVTFTSFDSNSIEATLGIWKQFLISQRYTNTILKKLSETKWLITYETHIENISRLKRVKATKYFKKDYLIFVTILTIFLSTDKEIYVKKVCEGSPQSSSVISKRNKTTFPLSPHQIKEMENISYKNRSKIVDFAVVKQILPF